MCGKQYSLVISACAALFLCLPNQRVEGQLDCTVNCNPTIGLIPVGSTGNYLINGNEITVTAGGLVYLEIRIAHWDPNHDGTPKLAAYQVTMDPSTYSSGLQGTVSPLTLPCLDSYICATQIGLFSCEPLGCCVNGSCRVGLLEDWRSDAVSSDLGRHGQVIFSFTNGRFVGGSDVGGLVDPGTQGYGGTLVLDVSPDAVGTFTISVLQAPTDTFLLDDTGNPIGPLVFETAKITVVPDGELFVRKNRFLTIHTGRVPGHQEAIRVKLTDLDGHLAALNGTTLWVGEPKKISARANKGPDEPLDPGEPFIWLAPLQCSPVLKDWTQFSEPIRLQHELIVPNSTYEIQLLLFFGNPANEADFSRPFSVLTPLWGDVAGPFDPVARVWTGPDGSVDVSTDVIAILDGFRGFSTVPDKTRVDLDLSSPDLLINITDVVQGLDAFQGQTFPFAPSVSPPCP